VVQYSLSTLLNEANDLVDELLHDQMQRNLYEVGIQVNDVELLD
jgi:hypothetical protein